MHTLMIITMLIIVIKITLIIIITIIILITIHRRSSKLFLPGTY